jgi:hypothetical protein
MFSIILILFLILCPMAAFTQLTAKSSLQAVDIDNDLSDAGLPGDVQVVKVNDISSVTLNDPVVILGSGMDSLERQLFDALSKKYKLNSSYAVYDSTRTFNKKSIEDFDLVVIGGPMHNSYTGELLGRGIIKYGTTNVKASGIVIEAGSLPSGHKVLVVASTGGYLYLDKTSLSNTTPSQNNSTPGENDVQAHIHGDLTPQERWQKAVNDFYDKYYSKESWQRTYEENRKQEQNEYFDKFYVSMLASNKKYWDEQYRKYIYEQMAIKFLNEQGMDSQALQDMAKYREKLLHNYLLSQGTISDEPGVVGDMGNSI